MSAHTYGCYLYIYTCQRTATGLGTDKRCVLIHDREEMPHVFQSTCLETLESKLLPPH